jgi:hypothetical protein
MCSAQTQSTCQPPSSLFLSLLMCSCKLSAGVGTIMGDTQPQLLKTLSMTAAAALLHTLTVGWS